MNVGLWYIGYKIKRVDKVLVKCTLVALTAPILSRNSFKALLGIKNVDKIYKVSRFRVIQGGIT